MVLKSTAAEGEGPVNAMDRALKKAMKVFYPELTDVRLTDFKVRVLNADATASSVRTLIESTDGHRVWRTVGVSTDILEASWQALVDSLEYKLMRIQLGWEELIMSMTMTQKILAAHAGLEQVSAGQLIEAKLDLVLGNDVTTPPAIKVFEKLVRLMCLTNRR
jgi:beta-glucosidase-like glycosyl hydrolase